MKRFLPLMVLALVVAAGTYGLTCWVQNRRPALAATDQLAWLRTEFHLTDAQFAQVKSLHEAYQPVCAGHCMQIMAAKKRLTTLEQEGKRDTPAYADALKDWTALKQFCTDATLKHMQSIAAVMDPAEGRRYLDLVTPHLAGQNHQEPMGMQ